MCFHTGLSQVNESALANTVEDTAAVNAISKQQILVQYLKASYSTVYYTYACITTFASEILHSSFSGEGMSNYEELNMPQKAYYR